MISMRKRILVTGGAGFIGSAVVRELISVTPHEVLVVDKLTYAGNLDKLEPVARDPRFAFVQADIVDAPRMRELLRSFTPEVIMHLAAESHVDRSIDGPGAFIQTNVVGTFTLLQAALEHWRTLSGPAREGFRFHHVSTDEVFGSLGAGRAFSPRRRRTSRIRPTRPQRLRQTTSCAPGITPTACPWCSPTALTTMAPTIFPRSSSRSIILNALEGKPLPVYGRGENVRDWLYVEDHARALILDCGEGPGRRELQRRRQQREDQSGGGAHHLCLDGRARTGRAHRRA